MNKDFNLVKNAWIPIPSLGTVNLLDVFNNTSLPFFGGNPIEKIALFKTVMAVAQASFTPQDEVERRAVGKDEFRRRCTQYLNEREGLFFLYGDKPFLQMPQIAPARKVKFDVLITEVATGNTTIIGHSQLSRELDDADKALLLITQMAFALGGKKVDNSAVLTPGYAGKLSAKGKPSTGKPGPATGFKGLLHSFVIAETLIDTIWINLLSHEQIKAEGKYPQGVGIAPWDKMPEGEDCDTARDLKDSLMGRLVPLSRFCLIKEDGVHYSEGISHGGYFEGRNDPTAAVDYLGSKPRALWVNPKKRPWRELTSLLSFLDDKATKGFSNSQLRAGVELARETDEPFAVWSGGLAVTSNAGEQYASGGDDYIESVIWLDNSIVGDISFTNLKHEMKMMDDISAVLRSSVAGFYRGMAVKEAANDYAQKAVGIYWEFCEEPFNELVQCCDSSESSIEARKKIRSKIANICRDAYNDLCPNGSARQIDKWAQNRPNLSKFFKD